MLTLLGYVLPSGHHLHLAACVNTYVDDSDGPRGGKVGHQNKN